MEPLLMLVGGFWQFAVVLNSAGYRWLQKAFLSHCQREREREKVLGSLLCVRGAQNGGKPKSSQEKLGNPPECSHALWVNKSYSLFMSICVCFRTDCNNTPVGWVRE